MPDNLPTKPRFAHDCPRCTYLGQTESADLYHCMQALGIPTLIARFSSELDDYASGVEFSDRIPALAEARRLAVLAGLPLTLPRQPCSPTLRDPRGCPTMTRHIDNSDDVIDSRDVIARIEELEGERDRYEIDGPDGTPEPESNTETSRNQWVIDNGDDADELADLKALAENAEGYTADWKYGETLIRDSYFENYARELAEDIGAIKDDAAWPNYCIDWERAASELRQDYTAVKFGDVTYWVR